MLRPKIACSNDNFLKLNKWFTETLSSLLGTISPSHINNTLHFKETIGSKVPHNHSLISFNVTILFTNVPIPQFLNFLAVRFRNDELPTPTTNFIKLFQICMKQKFFTFYNQYYRQIFGTGMGNSLSPIVTYFCMKFHKTPLVTTLSLYYNIHSWYRYIDDILATISVDFPVQQFLA